MERLLLMSKQGRDRKVEMARMAEGKMTIRGGVASVAALVSSVPACVAATATLHCGSTNATSPGLGPDIISLSRLHPIPARLPERNTDQPRTIPGGTTDAGLPYGNR